MNLSTEPTIKKPGNDTAPRKFMFERSFDDASIVHRAAERKPVLMKPEQVDALKKESYDAGFLDGEKSGKDAQTAHLESVINKVDHSIGIIIKSMEGLAEEQQAHTRQIVMCIAKKILPSFMARGGMLEIETILNETIMAMAREPRLVVRVHEEEFDAVNDRVQAIATQRAYSGKVIVLADPEIISGDCRIEWADGGVERNMNTTMAAIEQTILPPSL